MFNLDVSLTSILKTYSPLQNRTGIYFLIFILPYQIGYVYNHQFGGFDIFYLFNWHSLFIFKWVITQKGNSNMALLSSLPLFAEGLFLVVCSVVTHSSAEGFMGCQEWNVVVLLAKHVIQPIEPCLWLCIWKHQCKCSVSQNSVLLQALPRYVESILTFTLYILFIMILFIIDKIWKEPKYPTTDEWKEKLVYIHNGILLSYKKRRNFIVCTNLDEISMSMLGEVRNRR